jgi:2'-5' RNA ligase
MRLFLAVFPPPETQSLAHDAAAALKRAAAAEGMGEKTVSWVRLENLHYTLRFIGEVGEDGADRITLAANEAASSVAAFGVTLGGLGAFPRPRDARVLWVGLARGADPFRDLARGLDWTHSLARLNSLENDSAASFTVSRISVVVSHLSPKGSHYDIRAEAALAAAHP